MGAPAEKGGGGTESLWPPLPLAEWRETCDTLQLWTQIVGKIKLELCPFLNEWWEVALHLTPRGLTTLTIPAGDRVFAIDFDFVEHTMAITVSDGQRRTLPLRPRSVADFYRDCMAALRALGIDVAITTRPAEIPDAIPFDQDQVHAAYDPAYVERWHRIQLQTERVLQRFRSGFVGKSSPVQFFWGGFDLTMTRFSGRPAPLIEGAPRWMQLAEDQENYACGFWPGNANVRGVTLGEPAFYAYIYPEPAGFREAPVRPEATYFHAELGLFTLPYEAVRRAASAEGALLAFVESTYEASATLAKWDRETLERPRQNRGSAR